MGRSRAQIAHCRWAVSGRKLVSMLGYTYAQAYRRVVRMSSTAREAVQGTSLSEAVFFRLALILREFEGLPARLWYVS